MPRNRLEGPEDGAPMTCPSQTPGQCRSGFKNAEAQAGVSNNGLLPSCCNSDIGRHCASHLGFEGTHYHSMRQRTGYSAFIPRHLHSAHRECCAALAARTPVAAQACQGRRQHVYRHALASAEQHESNSSQISSCHRAASLGLLGVCRRSTQPPSAGTLACLIR